jgi:carbonic anhydrase
MTSAFALTSLRSCMDGRILPEEAFGIKAGTVNVLRNAGGRVAGAIPSILVSQVALGSHEIIVGEPLPATQP